ncbi:hypothetical protein Hanom_Chr14g01325861 [Helianthus anomalus]
MCVFVKIWCVVLFGPASLTLCYSQQIPLFLSLGFLLSKHFCLIFFTYSLCCVF